MESERQDSWGWLIAVALFLGGAGGGLFFVSFAITVLGGGESWVSAGAVVGPLLVLACALLLLIHLGRRTGIYRVLSSLSSSWMSRGALIMAVFVLLALANSVPAFSPFHWLPWAENAFLLKAFGWAAAVFGILVILYTGILLGMSKRIPLWNTPALPMLFLFSGLSTGAAVLLSTSPFFGQISGPNLRALSLATVVIILIELVVLGLFLEMVRHGSNTGAKSVRTMMNPGFVIGDVLLGMIVPLFLLAYAGARGERALLQSLSFAAGLFMLAGGISLRHGILRSGLCRPLFEDLN